MSATQNPLTQGADLRILSYNILAELWDDTAVLAPRVPMVSSVIRSFAPDVIGLQEVTPGWYAGLEAELGGLYQFASRTIPSGECNFSTILYHTEKAKLLSCETAVYSQGNSPLLRNLTWARFARIADGREYIVSCTHWDIYPELREVQWKENAALVKQIQEKYGCPVFCTGDYNCEETDLFGKFIREAGLRDPKYASAVISHADSTTHTPGSAVPDQNESIDHIAVAGNSDLCFYDMPITPDTVGASDHFPILIDVKL